MIDRMRPYAPSAVILFLILYFGVQALTGERGLLSGGQREALLERREAELVRLVEARDDLEVRVRYLRSDNLSRDLLEERARVVLGFADPRDYVIRVQPAGRAATGAA